MGVWEAHFQIEHQLGQRFQLRAKTSTSVSVADESVNHKVLRDGSIIDCGCVRLRFQVASPVVGDLWHVELWGWLFFSLIVIVELLLLFFGLH